MKRNIFKLFLNKFLSYPLWVKQVVYYRLMQNMTENFCNENIVNNADKVLSMHVPTLTFIGKQELWDKVSGWDSNIYNFLKFIHSGYSIMEAALNMFMSMEEISKLYIFCLEQNYFEAPESAEIYAMAGFIAGKFPVGDYFLKNGTISVEQLENALNIQKNYDQKGQHILLGEILVKQKYISENNLNLLFKLKADAVKRFVIEPEFLPENHSEEKLITKMENKISELQKENDALKKTMTEIVNTVKNYDI